jgi:hypothetical protein
MAFTPRERKEKAKERRRTGERVQRKTVSVFCGYCDKTVRIKFEPAELLLSAGGNCPYCNRWISVPDKGVHAAEIAAQRKAQAEAKKAQREAKAEAKKALADAEREVKRLEREIAKEQSQITGRCPKCLTELRLARRCAGRNVSCPACHERFHVPEAQIVPPPVEVPEEVERVEQEPQAASEGGVEMQEVEPDTPAWQPSGAGKGPAEPEKPELTLVGAAVSLGALVVVCAGCMGMYSCMRDTVDSHRAAQQSESRPADPRAREREEQQDLQAGKEVARRHIEAQLREINARVTLATDPKDKGGAWEVVGQLRDDGHGKQQVLWTVALTRPPDASNPGRSIWTVVNAEVYPPG